MSTVKVKVNPTFHEQLKDNGKWKKKENVVYKEYRRKWNENPKKYIIEKAPIHLDIETSSICNLRCPMCDCTIQLNKGKNDAFTHGLMTWELFEKIINEAAEIGVYSIKLNWRGEPTMNERLADMVKYAKDKGIIDIMFNTNGTRIDKKLSKALIDSGLDQIFFSVDSIDPERYAKIRVGANFDNVLDNIKTFVEYNDLAGHPVFTRVQKVLLTDTEDENDAFVDFWNGIVDQVAFDDYIPYGELEYGKAVQRDEKITFSCAQLWQRMFIAWDGECRVCCTSGGSSFVLGNVKKDSIANLWQCNLANELRKLHQSGEWYKCELCKKCYMPYM